jgi:hypothetical protein
VLEIFIEIIHVYKCMCKFRDKAPILRIWFKFIPIFRCYTFLHFSKLVSLFLKAKQCVFIIYLHYFIPSVALGLFTLLFLGPEVGI